MKKTPLTSAAMLSSSNKMFSVLSEFNWKKFFAIHFSGSDRHCFNKLSLLVADSLKVQSSIICIGMVGNIFILFTNLI